MKPRQEGVITEHKELSEKIEKLRQFLGSDDSDSLAKMDYNLMLSQLRIMSDYLDILNKRISRFTDENRSSNI